MFHVKTFHGRNVPDQDVAEWLNSLKASPGMIVRAVSTTAVIDAPAPPTMRGAVTLTVIAETF